MKRLIVGLLLGSTLVFAQAQPVSDVSHDKLLIAYQRATILKQQADAAVTAAKTADDTFRAAVADYTTARDAAVKLEKLPKGTDFQIDIVAGTVTAVTPAKTAAPLTAAPQVSTQPTQ